MFRLDMLQKIRRQDIVISPRLLHLEQTIYQTFLFISGYHARMRLIWNACVLSYPYDELGIVIINQSNEYTTPLGCVLFWKKQNYLVTESLIAIKTHNRHNYHESIELYQGISKRST